MTNSRIALKKLDRNERQAMIYRHLHLKGIPLTDRQIKDGLGFTDMNQVRPRITELIQSKDLRHVDNTVCRETGRPVRRCEVSRRNKRKWA